MASAIIAGLMQHKVFDVTPAQHPSELLESMPEPESFVHSGMILRKSRYKKRNNDFNYSKVFRAVTDTAILIATDPSDQFCMDLFQLHEVTFDEHEHVTHVHAHEQIGQCFFAIIPDEGTEGRRMDFQVDSHEQLKTWIKILKTQSEAARELHRLTPAGKAAKQLKDFHDADVFQNATGFVIFISFLISIVETQMVPADTSSTFAAFRKVDMALTGLFTAELVVTFGAHPPPLFFQDGWRIFDMLAVTLSVVALLPGLASVKALRAVRVVRAIRLSRKSKRLRPILKAVFAAVKPILNAFLICGLITIVYSSIAVGLFGEDEPVLFGTLSRSTFTMFQAALGDSWGSVIVRTMGDGHLDTLAAVFFTSYMLMCSIVMLNVRHI